MGGRLKWKQKQDQRFLPKYRPVSTPQWHVKECYVPPVPTLPVASVLCQAFSPFFPVVPCPGSGQRDRSQTPIMCLHQAACLVCPDPWGSAGTVPYSSQEYAKVCGWCQTVDMSCSAHTFWWIVGRRVVEWQLFFLSCSNASTVGILCDFS